MSSKYSFYSNCGCLHSESTTTLKMFTKNSPEKLQTHSHSYSQACLQNLSNADSVKKMFVSKESIHVVKLNDLRKRMIATLNGIQSLLGDGPQPDGVEDLKRRQQRAAEFSSRFCRNYLYPLQRQMDTITKMWKNQLWNHTHSAYFNLRQKVIATHQNAHLALQAYLHHIPCSVEKGVPDKLEELLQVVNNLCSLCSKLDMSEGDSDFSSKRVKQHCQQLMLQIKAEVCDEEGESCTHKNITLPLKKKDVSHRFSMYARNSLQKPSFNQNKRAVKMFVTPKKRPIKLHCNRQAVKEVNVSPHCNLKNVHGKLTPHKSHEKVIEEGSDIGEVCASDDVRTMMEFFRADEVPAQSDTSLKQVNSKKPASSFLTELDKPSILSTNTFKKLEDEIKNLKKQTKSLEEIGHPNYSFYIKALETLSHQFSGMKSQKLISNTSRFQTMQAQPQKQIKQMINKRLDSEFPKNVKLICLSSEADNESSNAAHNYLVSPRSTSKNNRKNYAKQQEDNALQPTEWQGKESIKNETLIQDEIQINNDWKPQDVCKHHNMNHKSVSEFTESQSTCDVSVRGQHFNTPITESSKEKVSEYSKDTETGNVNLTISQHEIESAVVYRKEYQDYMSSSSLYRESLRPWLMVARLANNLIDNILEEITLNDIGIQKITSGLLQLEFQ